MQLYKPSAVRKQEANFENLPQARASSKQEGGGGCRGKIALKMSGSLLTVGFDSTRMEMFTICRSAGDSWCSGLMQRSDADHVPKRS